MHTEKTKSDLFGGVACLFRGVAASLGEAATQSKDLYHYENAYSVLQQKFPDLRPESIY
jgi:hypothetical protein